MSGIHLVDGARGCNVYLLVDDESATLVDTGLPGNAPRVSRCLDAIGTPASRLRRILLTHGHPDHTGSVRALRRLAQVRVLAHPGDVRHDRRGRPRLRYAAQPLALNWDVPFLQRVYADDPMEDGAFLPIGGGLTVIHAPGHTPGSVVLHMEREGVLFTGDTLLSARGRVVRPFPFPGTNFRQYRSSVEQLERLDFDTICPGHGRPLVGRAAQGLRDMLKDYFWAASGFNRLRRLKGFAFHRPLD